MDLATPSTQTDCPFWRASAPILKCRGYIAGVAGIRVHIAARVMALASGDEVLASRTVRDLAAGSDIVFTERGAHVLKGVPGEWEIYAVPL